MINPLLRLFFCTVLLLASNPLLAVQPSSAQINQLLEAGRTQQTLTHITAHVVQAVWQALESELTKQTSLSSTDIDAINVTLGSSLVKALSWEQMRPHYQHLYAHSLNSNQAQVLLDFYRSPVGQIIVTTILQAVQDPRFMQENSQTVLEAVEPIIEEAISNIDEKYLIDFLQLQKTHGVLEIYMQLFTDSVELMQQQAEPVLEEVITRELTKALTN